MDVKLKFMNTCDSDDELPSLAARIQNACKLKNDISMQAIAPCGNESATSQKSKVCESTENSPKFNNFEIKDPSAMESTLFSESEDESKFLNFLEKVKATPRTKRSPLPLALTLSSDSEDDYPFCLGKPAESFFTPVPQKRSIPVKISASAQKYSSNRLKEKNSELLPTSKCFHQPKAPCKLNITPENRVEICLYSDSEDESEFLKVVQTVRQTPCSVKKFASDQAPVSKKKYPSNVLKEKNSGQSNAMMTSSRHSSSSEDESEFERFVEKIRQTSLSTKKKHLSPAVKNSPNDLLSNVIKSLKRIESSNSDVSSVSLRSTSDCPEKMKLFASPCSVSTKKISPSWFNSLTISKAWTAAQKENAENYSKLFTGEPKFCKSFPQCRDFVATKLFSFFNKTVFDSKLPDNLPLIWSNRLTHSAGMFCVKSSKGSFIQLSLPFLTSLDRLQDTLIHEMCHAAVYFISKNRRECHGPLWQIWASRCNLILPFIKCPERCHNYDIVK